MTQDLCTGANLGLFADWIGESDGPTLSIVPNRKLGETLYVNLESTCGERVGFLPAWDINPGESEHPGEAIQERRLELLDTFRTVEINHLIVSVRGLGVPVLSPGVLESLTLRVGDRISPVELNRKLTNLGFERQDLVESRGDYALRGDLLDFYPERSPYPLRVTFFDDEIEDVEYFHPNTQMQADDAPEQPLHVYQQSEFALAPDEREHLVETLRDRGFSERADRLESRTRPDEVANWFGIWPRKTVQPESLLPDAKIGLFRPADCWEEVEEWQANRKATDDELATATFRDLETVLSDLLDPGATHFCMHYQDSPITPETEPERRGEIIEVTTDPGGEPNPIQDFIDIVDELTERTTEIVIHCGEEGFRERLEDLLQDQFGSASVHNETRLDLRETPWHGSYLRNGRARLSLDDFFNRTIQRGRIGPNRSRTEYLESFEELSPGDLVVHEHHGIGRFQGLKRISTKNQTRDCLNLDYQGNDKLFLPPDQIAWVQKYVADSGFTPSLSSLSGGNWDRIKEGVEEEINDLAQDLLELYTNREDRSGQSFEGDSLEQTQFEASFPYRETPDQQEAIEAVKSDMESTEPMDRLICGDSGFGKTEVGLRAAFKAVSSGHQVAMLVPTTVLARQHYETFSNRFSIFPYTVEMLSRFETPSETRQILENLESGDTDVVIGTHRLLSDDVGFDQLGLLIIDEEQRFGVEQKEKLKFYRQDVDVLTLSATPIPRTLYMTLSGIQDISRINTPPEDRVPITVDVGPFNPGEASEAIERELSRGGQVFWVYNRVQDIQQRAEYVKSLYPEAEVAIAHGQMSKSTLRETMNRFYEEEIDILVCTTIIESGLDCPTVNTMILEEAHEFGLAQLYQLRGRVGRSHEKAYVKMFYPEDVRLTDDAEARLQAIKQCSELGAGFNVAMRDLEIRGAGNILGKKQHGNIRAVGFPLYCRMLQREIRKLREEFEVPKPYPKLKLPGEYYIPRDYIPGEKQIIRQYQELSSCRSIEEVDELQERWRETFGPLPDPVRAVLDRHKFKILADQFGWEDFRYSNNRLSMRFGRDAPEQLLDAARTVGARPSVRSDRLIVESFPAGRVRDWIAESVSGRQPARESEVPA